MDKTVMCYLKKNDTYLLLYRNKKENDLNEGKYIGIGGHIEEGESKEEALVREVKEETNLDLLSYRYCGEVLFVNNDYQEIMYIYYSDDFTGELSECNEGTLTFVKEEDIYSLNMWEGDKLFLPYVLKESKSFKMKIIYEDKTLKDYEVLI